MKKKKQFCYMCGHPATSKEHVPPACLFPEEKDIKTSIFRNNLITVPSCDLHNLRKSKDDEYLMACLASNVGNNVIAFFHTHTKVKRAMERRGKDFTHLFMQDAKSFNLETNQGKLFPVLIGRVDHHRLHSCFEHIARGLYYYKFGNPFDGECNIVIDFVTYENEDAEKFKLLCRKRIELEPNKPKAEGANPEIFRYEFIEPDKFGLIGLCLTFYEGAKVFIAFKAKQCDYFDLTGSLIDAGIRTVIGFPDGTKFEFNK